jgi:tetrapyrrole methylase family protein/MazG family protein
MKKYNFEDLKNIVAELRVKCPWDRKQTHESLIKNLVEETYEVIEAIEEKDFNALKEELGDLLLQVVFHSKLAEEKGYFNIDEVIDFLCKKLIVRHPHVFGDAKNENLSAEEVLKRWEKSKMKDSKKSPFDSIPKSLPALRKAYKYQHKAEKLELYNPSEEKIKKQIEEDFKKLNTEKDKEKLTELFGRLLFHLTHIARKLDIDPERALNLYCKNFEKEMLKKMEREKAG